MLLTQEIRGNARHFYLLITCILKQDVNVNDKINTQVNISVFVSRSLTIHCEFYQSQDLGINSPRGLLYISNNCSPENLVLPQILSSTLYFSFFSTPSLCENVLILLEEIPF